MRFLPLLLLLACFEPLASGSNGLVKVAGFGDSVTANTPGHNASWLKYLPQHIQVSIHGQPWATCPYVYRNMWSPVIGDLPPDTVVVLICHTPDFSITPLEDALEAVLKMREEAGGLHFIFATQPAWHVSQRHRQPDSRAFYDALLPLLEGTTFIDNDEEWKLQGLDSREELYTDGVHLKPAGASILAEAVCKEVPGCA